MKNIKNECNQIIYIKENKIWQIIHTLGQETRAWSNNFRVPIRQTWQTQVQTLQSMA